MQIRYFSDALAARRNDMDAEAAQWAKQDAKQARFKVPADLDPRIGSLMTVKGVKFYAYINGQYTEGSVESLTAELN